MEQNAYGTGDSRLLKIFLAFFTTRRKRTVFTRASPSQMNPACRNTLNVSAHDFALSP